MKHYCICPRETFFKFSHLLNTPDRGHFLDLGEGDEILVAVNFTDEATEHMWYSLPGVEPLPHPHFQGNHKVKSHHIEKIKKTLPIVEHGHTVLHIAHHVGKAHPLMKLNRFLRPDDSE